MRALILATGTSLLLLLPACGGGGSACDSYDDAYELSQRISKAMIEIAQSDPERLESIAERMRTIGEKYAETSDPEYACEAYESMLEELDL